MKLILHLNDFTWQVTPNHYGSTLAEIAWAAEAAGFERIGVADHVWQAPQAGGPEVPELECYTTMAFLAAHTSRAELMAIVTGVHFRNPGLLAKMVTTLDVLSGGRVWLGIGAGHYEDEARGLGIPFPPLAERFGWLDETLQICLRMWSGERGDERPFEGKYFHLERPLNLPQSLRRPHPPISHRRRRRTEDAATGGALRERLLAATRATDPGEAGDLAPVLRGRGSRLRRDREDLRVPLRRWRRRRQGGRAHWAAALAGQHGRPDRDRCDPQCGADSPDRAGRARGDPSDCGPVITPSVTKTQRRFCPVGVRKEKPA